MSKRKLLLEASGLATLATAGGAYYTFHKVVKRDGFDAKSGKIPVNTGTDWTANIKVIKEKKAWLLAQKIEKVHITSFDGLTLRGTFLPARKESNQLVLCVHGYRSEGKNEFAALSQFYHQAGYHVLLVDNRAHGESEGKYIGFGCLDRYDLVRWIEYINKRFLNKVTIYLHGISMGGATVLMSLNMNLPENIAGVISDCGFTSAWDVFSHILKNWYHVPEFPLLHTTSRISKHLAGYYFDEVSAKEEIRKTKLPVLIIHGEKDTFVPTWMGKELFQACNSPKKELLIVKGAGHGESYYVNTALYQSTVIKFLEGIEKGEVK